MNSTLQQPSMSESPMSGSGAAEEQIPKSRLQTADDYADAARRRTHKFLFGAALLAAAVSAAFVGFGLDNIWPPFWLLIAFLLPILLWRYPKLIFYVVLASTCLFELGLLDGPDGKPYADALTDAVPVFWNINTIFQIYGKMDFKGIPLNLLEVLMLLAGASSLIRSAYTKTANLRAGELIWPISVYMAFVAAGWINGLATGGDFKLSLQEIRSQFYFGLAYLLAVNMVQSRKQIVVGLWIMIFCIGLKGILFTYRRYVTLSGITLPDQGVGGHEEAFFFDVFVMLLLTFTTCKTFPKMRWTMLALLPLVMLGSLACNRRAGTAAFVVIIPTLVLALYQAMPTRRRLIVLLSAAVLVALGVYFQAFKNSNSILAQPARAIQSQFSPDPRDASSNAYRDAENADLMATVKSAPLGYGYGKHMLHAVPIADISGEYEWWDIMTHNQVLWVWMRVGTFGFISFWMMVSAILLCAAKTIRNPSVDRELKSIAISGMVIVGALMIFGLLDLQFSNFRDMLFTGLWSGILAALPGISAGTSRARSLAA